MLIPLDIYRRQARNLAWYDEEGEASSHNPFKKFRHQRRLRRSNSVQLESGPSRRSLGDLSEDHRRRQDMNSGLGGPEYSGSFPAEFAGSEQGTPSTHHSLPEPSMASQDPINVSRGLDAETGESGLPRQRKGGFLGKFRHHDDGLDEDKKSLSEPQQFTLASQLRATILNSWINVLLIAAPVGSMYCPSPHFSQWMRGVVC